MSYLFALNAYFKKYKSLFGLGIVFVLFSNYFRVLSPRITRYVLDLIVKILSSNSATNQTEISHTSSFLSKLSSLFIGNPTNLSLLQACLVIFFLAIFSGVFMFFMRQTLIVMSRKIEFDQKNEIYSHYQSMDFSFLKNQSIGDLMNRISEDVSRVRMYTGPALMYIVNLIAVITMCIYFMWNSDPKLTLITLSPLPILAFVIYKVNIIIHSKSEKIQGLLGKITSIAQESFSGIRVIKSFVQEKNTIDFFVKESESYRREAMGLARTEAIYFPIIGLLIGTSTLLAILFGSLDVVHQQPGASVGKIAEFVLYIQMLTFPVSAIGWTVSMIQRAAASQKRINEFLSVQPKITDPINPITDVPKADIEFKQVNYIHQNTGIPGLVNLNVQIKKGEKIAIVGKIGSGKSTFANILLRFLSPDNGIVSIGNIPIEQFSLKLLRNTIGYVPQDNFLFSDSIFENIRFGKAGANLDEVQHAASIAGIHEEILSFPNGYQTIVGERGIMLSGGQKQRISIARAILKNTPILIFDDSLSAIDAHKEQDILNNLNKSFHGKTVIIITHRFFSNLEFDKILVMNEGKLVEMGAHDQLMAQKGVYYNLYMRQQLQ